MKTLDRNLNAGRRSACRVATGITVVCVGAWLAGAATFQEDFTSDPLAHGWRLYGEPSLFHWNPANQNLEVTWDSSRANSYLQLPLGTLLARDDDFSFALVLRINDLNAGVNPDKPSTFELALGFQNTVNAEATNFLRGTGRNLLNLVEFDFFPDTGFGPTLWPIAWSTNGTPNYNGSSDYTLIELPVGIPMRVNLAYTANDQTIRTTITTNDGSIGPINPVQLSTNFADFRVGTFALMSYSDAGQSGPFAGSLLAHGVVSQILITAPPSPVQNLRGGFTNGVWQAQFASRSNWLYTLERSVEFQSWTAATLATAGNGTTLVLQDTNAPAAMAFYRVRAERP